MQRKTKIQLLLAVLIGAGVSGCLKIQTSSPIPSIVFKSWLGLDTANTPTATVLISFADGDGDIGGGTFPDSIAPYKALKPTAVLLSPENFPAAPYYDLIMLYYYPDVNGIFRRFFDYNSKDSFQLNYHLTNLTSGSGPNKSLQGEISTIINIGPYWPTDPSGHPFPNQKNFKYDIFIYDRAGHKSNVVSTPLMQIP